MSSSLNVVGAHRRRQFDGMAAYTRNWPRCRDGLVAVRPSIDQKSSARHETHTFAPLSHASARSRRARPKPIDASLLLCERRRSGNRRLIHSRRRMFLLPLAPAHHSVCNDVPRARPLPKACRRRLVPPRLRSGSFHGYRTTEPCFPRFVRENPSRLSLCLV